MIDTIQKGDAVAHDSQHDIAIMTLYPIITQVLGSCFVSVVFAACFGVFRQLYGGAVIFYEALICGGVLSCATLIGLAWVRRVRGDTALTRACLVCLLPGTLLYVLFVSLVPTIIDRSVSVTVLGKLHIEGAAGATEAQLNKHFENLYVNNGKAVRVRLYEQVVSGNVRQDGDKFFITPQGSRTVNILRLIGRMFKVNLEYLNARPTRKS